MNKFLKSLPLTELECRVDFFLQALKGVLALNKEFNGPMQESEAVQYKRELDNFIGALDEERSVAELALGLIACREILSKQASFGKAEIDRRSTEAKQVCQLLARHLCILTQDNREVLRDLEACGDGLDDLQTFDDLDSIKASLVDQATALKSATDRQRGRVEFTTQQMAVQVSTLMASVSRVGRRLTTDPVTGVEKREAFIRRLSEKVQAADPGRFALLLWDVDGLQSVNDRFGEMAGDSALRNLAMQCQRMIRGGDYLCRYDGDEFGIVLDDVDESLAARRGQEIVRSLSALSTAFSDGREQHDFKVSICMGIAEYAAGDSPDSLLERARGALNDAKREGAGLCRCFTPSS